MDQRIEAGARFALIRPRAVAVTTVSLAGLGLGARSHRRFSGCVLTILGPTLCLRSGVPESEDTVMPRPKDAKQEADQGGPSDAARPDVDTELGREPARDEKLGPRLPDLPLI